MVDFYWLGWCVDFFGRNFVGVDVVREEDNGC
jgi:hypothetical protein